MREDPIPDKAPLYEALYSAYGIRVARAEFVPSGDLPSAWVIAEPNGQRRFLKAFSPERLAALGREQLGYDLALARELRETGICRVPGPLPARDGRLLVDFDGGALALLEHVAGRTLEREIPLPDRTVAELGRALGRLHAATPRLSTPIPRGERFRVPFATELSGALEVVASIGSDERPGRRRARALVEPRRPAIEAGLARLGQLALELASDDAPRVLCHTDLHGGNLIESERGELWLLDWEGATLSPVEADLLLAFPVGRHITRAQVFDLLDAYAGEAGAPELDARRFEFFITRRCLVDLRDSLVRILARDRENAQDRFDLALLQSECLDWLPRIPRDLELVRELVVAR